VQLGRQALVFDPRNPIDVRRAFAQEQLVLRLREVEQRIEAWMA
jgi:hypothetical protein